MTDAPTVDSLAAHDRFDVAVAVLVVATTLAAAWVGLLFAQASNQAEKASGEAVGAALDASKAGLATDQRVDEALTTFQRAREQAARARSAVEDRDLGGRPRAAAEARRRIALAERTERSLHDWLRANDGAQPGIHATGTQGPVRDSLFPLGFRTVAHEPVHVQLARRDAANARSAEWGQRTASYAAILTLLAVALYLFGFALAPQGRPLRGLFATVGTVFLCLGLMFGPVRALSSPDRAPDGAATEYARGAVAVRSATRPSEYATAEDHLARAIRARPDFADAYQLREIARFNRGTPQFVTAASLTTPSALQRALEDVRMARSLGVRTSTNLANEGFYLFVLGVRTHRPELLEEALGVTRAAVKAQPDELIARFNLAVTLLAAGRAPEARGAYESALADLVAQPWGMLRDLGSGALTDLELVAEHSPIELADDVRDAKELIAAAMARERAGEPRAKAPATEVTARVEPGLAEVTLDNPELWGTGGVLSVSWYHEERQRLGWSNLPQLFTTSTGFASEITSPSYVAETKRCLPDGRYRAEVYLGGRLVGSATTTYDGDGIAPVVDRDHGLVGCMPMSWDERPADSPLVSTSTSADGRSGMHLVRLDRPLSDARRAIERVLGKLVRTPAGPPRHVAQGDYLLLAGTWPNEHTYAYPGGELHAASTVLADQSTIVAIVFGPRRDLAANPIAPRRILSSLALTHPPVIDAP